ncbi:hypothetical protein NQ317_017577 [Molorchus minor]|uniref:Endonuclease/exonuclease/phosphatase domain-containing protein n=1 Tax=Molorchus minor TaxID=1323400 RepID=A0ABQ9JS40_9CUCU|nr:hypothetical protein NQ317_017577 [Molorchus minor]
MDDQLIRSQGNPDGQMYQEILENELPPLLEDLSLEVHVVEHVVVQHALVAGEVLDRHFDDCWIGRAGPVNWPASSSDLTSPDFVLRGYLKDKFYKHVQTKREHMIERIRNAWAEVKADTLLSCSVQIKFKCKNKSILITAIYRPPSTCEREFTRQLIEHLHEISKEKVDYNVIIGDININLKLNNDVTEEYLNAMSEFGFQSLINSITREDGETKSCIDHIFLRAKEDIIKNNVNSFVLKNKITDHCPILLKIKTNSTNISENKQENRYVHITDYKKLKLEVKKINWDEFYNANTIDEQTDLFIDNITKRKKNSKQVWNIVNDISKTSKSNNINEIVSNNGELISDNDKMANTFNDYFTNVAETNAADIKRTIMTLKNNKTPGVDLIKAETLKEIADDISNQLAYLTAETVKYLGITIDRHLTWDHHITNICNNLRNIIYKLKYIKNILDISSITSVYYALIESRIRYGIIAWGKPNTYSSDQLYKEARVLDTSIIFPCCSSLSVFNKIKNDTTGT